MITISEALDHVCRWSGPLEPELQTLAAARGCTLAEDIVSDMDSPPFHKALMDGYAVRSADLVNGHGRLRRVEVLPAGSVAVFPVNDGEATQIMTGAPLPAGADAVVKIEDTVFDADTQTAVIETRPVQPGQNVLQRGAAVRSGEAILSAGCRLDAQHLGTLAEFGRATILVLKRPRVAVLATGDELVPVDQTPGPGQIRNSNEAMLVAQIQRAGAQPIPLGIAADNRRELGERVAVGLEHEMLILSGGVSAGQLDLVPDVLEAAGVDKVFHKVKIKPGKPVWFGVRPRTGDQSNCLVFGLPGNPVSSMVGFELLARTAISRMSGRDPGTPRPLAARLSQDHLVGGDRPTYHPAHVSWSSEGWIVRPVRWVGSADLRGTVEANAMIHFPAIQQTIPAGELVDVIPWDTRDISGAT